MHSASIDTFGNFADDGVKKAHFGHSLVSPWPGACSADMQPGDTCFDYVTVGRRDVVGGGRR
jgi:hypothetical protein